MTRCTSRPSWLSISGTFPIAYKDTMYKWVVWMKFYYNWKRGSCPCYNDFCIVFRVQVHDLQDILGVDREKMEVAELFQCWNCTHFIYLDISSRFTMTILTIHNIRWALNQASQLASSTDFLWPRVSALVSCLRLDRAFATLMFNLSFRNFAQPDNFLISPGGSPDRGRSCLGRRPWVHKPQIWNVPPGLKSFRSKSLALQ